MKQDILRYFNIAEGWFIMFSRIEGEFGIQELQTQANTDVIQQVPTQNSAPVDFNFRLGEMQYFLQLYNLFNPKLKVDYGIQEKEKDSEDLP